MVYDGKKLSDYIEDESEDKLVHIHGKSRNSLQSYIIGNKRGLLALQQIINNALENNSISEDVFTNDEGNWRQIRVIFNDSPQDSPFRKALPNTWPWDVWNKLKEQSEV